MMGSGEDSFLEMAYEDRHARLDEDIAYLDWYDDEYGEEEYDEE